MKNYRIEMLVQGELNGTLEGHVEAENEDQALEMFHNGSLDCKETSLSSPDWDGNEEFFDIREVK